MRSMPIQHFKEFGQLLICSCNLRRLKNSTGGLHEASVFGSGREESCRLAGSDLKWAVAQQGLTGYIA